ncbi:MAG TPA: alkaline phosphatase family protein [Bryobacteraceae bacterium]|nr:alkaline phosphatase family protein [Bryobacteraceae bacterium]
MRNRLLAALLPVSISLLSAVAASGQQPSPATPIKHLVVIFPENISFDHYFGTYPHAANPPNEPRFVGAPDTPSVNGLSTVLLTGNANASNPANGPGAVNPFRLDRSQAATADQDHSYTAEQMAFHAGLMDLFPKSVGRGNTAMADPSSPLNTTGLTMGYFDGNTVTALWNYAQRFAMSDNSYGSTFGPSTPGAINLISGQTNGVVDIRNGRGGVADGGNGSFTLISDPDPVGDVCSASTRMLASMAGKNIGNLLNEAHVTWGWFEGGFDLSVTNSNGTSNCARSSKSPVSGKVVRDYVPHHQPFQYYPSTANPSHVRPTSVQSIGRDGDAANHQYDVHDFFDALKAGNFPQVSFLKAPAYQDAHAGYSNPLDEQTFLVQVINFLQNRPEWKDTAVVIAYDDSDGWYDHQMSPIVNQSAGSTDALTGPGSCGDGHGALPGVDATNSHAQGRCGFGPRLPLLVISPWAKVNFVDHSLTNQASIITFVEDNWFHRERLGQGSFDSISNSITSLFDFGSAPRMGKLVLDENTGEKISTGE